MAIHASCALVDSWLRSDPGVDEVFLLEEALVEHVRGCARCRGALLVLLTDLTGTPTATIDTSCATAEDQLAAFVDYERAHGLPAAIGLFASVWWHTLVCPGCAALYADLAELADTPYEPWRGAVLVAPPPPTIRQWALLQISALRQLLGIERRLGVAWGAQRPDTLVADVSGAEGRLQVLLRHEESAGHALVVRTEPPLAGAVVLTTGGASYRAALDLQGSAVFARLADDLVADPGDGVVAVSIEPLPDAP